VLFGLAYMTPIIVLGIFGVIAELSDGGSAGSYLIGHRGDAVHRAELRLDGQALSGRRFGLYVRAQGARFTAGDSLWDGAICLITCSWPLVIWLIGGSYLQGQFPSVPFFVWIVAFIVITSTLNVIGLKVADRTNFVLMTVQLLILALFVILSIHTPGRRFTVAGFHHAVHGRQRLLRPGGRCRSRGVLVPWLRRQSAR